MNDTAPAPAPIRRRVLRKRGLPMRACSGSGCFLARLLACSPALGRGVKRPLGRGRTRRLALLVGRQAEISTVSTLYTAGFSADELGNPPRFAPPPLVSRGGERLLLSFCPYACLPFIRPRPCSYSSQGATQAGALSVPFKGGLCPPMCYPPTIKVSKYETDEMVSYFIPRLLGGGKLI